MKREGRQHGMVRTCPVLSGPFNPRPSRSRLINELHSPPTAGLYAKVPTKPTNHSKYTGKCGRPACRMCHDAPAGKSKHKVKGANKIKSTSDTVSDPRLVSWRVVDTHRRDNVHGGNLKMSGFSAKGILDYLDSRDSYAYDHEDDYDHDQEVDYDHNDEELDDVGGQLYDARGVLHDNTIEIEEVVVDDDGDDNDGINVDDDDDNMSFCEVGIIWETLDDDDDDEDESWCLVQEM